MLRPSLPDFISHSVLRGRYVFLDLNQRCRSRGPVACAGWEECLPDYEIRRDGFRFSAMEYIAGGDWELETKAGKWRLQPGSCFSYGAGISYSLKAVSRTGLRKYFLDFTDVVEVSALSSMGIKPGVPCSLQQRRWVQDLLDQLIDAARLPRRSRRRVANLITNILLERLREDLKGSQRISQSRLSYERCRQYLADDYLRVSSISEAARRCGVSPVHLSRLFQQHATEPPHTFVARLKMNHAAQLIARESVPVKAAAAEVGYDDPYHFSRVFKRVHGVAPSRFSCAKNDHEALKASTLAVRKIAKIRTVPPR